MIQEGSVNSTSATTAAAAAAAAADPERRNALASLDGWEAY